MTEHAHREAPITHMSFDEAQEFVRILTAMPSNTGFSINHCIEPPHTPGVFNGYNAVVILPNGGRGESGGDNPALAFRTAWARAHLDQAEILMPKAVDKS